MQNSGNMGTEPLIIDGLDDDLPAVGACIDMLFSGFIVESYLRIAL